MIAILNFYLDQQDIITEIEMPENQILNPQDTDNTEIDFNLGHA